MSGVAEKEVPAGEIERDRWSRPLIVPLDGGKPVAYTRCTTYVGCLEDTFNLTAWGKRMVAAGLGQRSDLALRASSLGLEPDDYEASRPWKRQMDDLCEQALQAAGGSAKATIGTALHALTERMDRGEDVGAVPDSYVPHLRAYNATTAAFEHLHIERFTVNDELKIGGTPDRVLRIPGYDKPIIGDLKTGNVEFGIGKMAMQLSVYANSVAYNPDGTREPLGDVDLERGLIIALDAKTAECRLIWVDIAAGWEAVQLATQVRAWRARKDLARPYEPLAQINDTEGNAYYLSPTAFASLPMAIAAAESQERLYELWRMAGTSWTPEMTDLAAHRKAELEVATRLGGVVIP